MIPNNFKDSLLIKEQFPFFVRNEDAYQTFISFVEAYYEFLEENNNLSDRTKNLLNYKDVDNTLEEFHQYFFNEFLQYFPKDAVTNKIDLVKFARELYQRKSTPASFKFLFRALYNSDCETVNTRDFVLIPSDGKWQISRFVRLNTIDPSFLDIKNYKLFGETSKAIGKIENSKQLSGRTEVFLSDIIREFKSGEYVRVVDQNLKDVYVNGVQLRTQIIGFIEKINVDPLKRGSGYNPQDPVIIYGGLETDIVDPQEATAEVERVSIGSVQSVTLLDGANGFRTYPNTTINISGGGGTGLDIRVANVDSSNATSIFISSVDVINTYSTTAVSNTTYQFPNFASANANTKLVDAFTSYSFDTYPISQLSLENPGSFYSSVPTITPISNITVNDFTYDIKDFGILAPIRISFGGYNYSNGDIINLVGGSGTGAYANVKLVDSNGTIQQVRYIQDTNNLYPLGGFGYRNDSLPTISISSTNNKIINLSTNSYSAANSNILYFANTANLKIGMYVNGAGIANTKILNYFDSNTRVSNVSTNFVELTANLSQEIFSGTSYKFDGSALVSIPSVLGTGAKIGLSYETIGAIQSIRLINKGGEYTTNPSVSLRILDIVVQEINESLLPSKGDFIYQGETVKSFVFGGFIDSVSLSSTTYSLRIYDYSGTLNTNDSLYIDKFGENSRTLSYSIDTTYGQSGFTSGVKYFGDGKAKANAQFLSGVLNLQGRYLNSDGFLSDSNYLQSEIYNFYSYFLTLEKSFADYKDLVKNLLNPASKQLISVDSEKSSQDLVYSSNTDILRLTELKDVTNPNTRFDIIGGISDISIVDGSNGFRLFPNSIIDVTATDFSGYGANVTISEIDTSNVAVVSLISVDIINDYKDKTIDYPAYGFPNFFFANSNTKLVDALTTVGFNTYPISNVAINSGGLNYTSTPIITAKSLFTYNSTTYDLKDFGILSLIKINFGGFNYSNNDVILLSGGSGTGAYANVKLVDSNGTIKQVQYIQDVNNLYPLGGLGYSSTSLPTISVQSTNNKIIYLTTNVFANIGNTILYTSSSTTNVKVGMYITGNGLSSETKIVNVAPNNIQISQPLEYPIYSGNTYVVNGTANLSVISVLGDGATFSANVDPTVITPLKLIGSLLDENELKIYELRKEETGISLSDVLSANDYIEVISTNHEYIESQVESIDDINDIIYLKDYFKLLYDNVAFGYTSGNTIIVSNTTSAFNLYFGKNYSNTLSRLEKMVYANDSIYISNNLVHFVNWIDYPNNIIYTDSTFEYSVSSSTPQLISVQRNFISNNIYIQSSLE